jgi:hypothetical protein
MAQRVPRYELVWPSVASAVVAVLVAQIVALALRYGGPTAR